MKELVSRFVFPKLTFRPRSFFHARHAFTLIELLVVVAIIGLLIALVIPSLGRARYKGRTVSCASQLRQITIGIMAYSIDYKDLYPDAPNGRFNPDYVAWLIGPATSNGVAGTFDWRPTFPKYFGTSVNKILKCPHLSNHSYWRTNDITKIQNNNIGVEMPFSFYCGKTSKYPGPGSPPAAAWWTNRMDMVSTTRPYFIPATTNKPFNVLVSDVVYYRMTMHPPMNARAIEQSYANGNRGFKVSTNEFHTANFALIDGSVKTITFDQVSLMNGTFIPFRPGAVGNPSYAVPTEFAY